MSQKTSYDPKQEKELMQLLWSPEIKNDPYRFVMAVYPWGKKGTPLEKFKGPRAWQVDELKRCGEHYRRQIARLREGLPLEIYKSATTSGRGPGKSTLVSWLNHWFMSCVIGGIAITTANTEAQLKTKTWAELGKWVTMSINAHWFERNALSLRPAPWFKNLLENELKVDTGYYYAEALLWNEDNPDAFAGAHNFNGTMLIFDEASGIPQKIWDVSEGFFTEPVAPRFWFVFSNPRRNTGPFFECFHKHRDFWPYRRHIDSRTVEGIDRKVLDDIILKNGEDSDVARIEVKGEFPSHGDNQFISRDIVDGAIGREIEYDEHAALVMGVDPARFGRDKTVIAFRRGRDAKSIPWTILEKKDNMEVANICAELIDRHQPDGVFIDAGNGTGIIDRLKEMGYKCYEVWFGSSSSKQEYANKRTELWADMRDWLRGGTIPSDSHLRDDLVSPEYKFMGRSDQIALESKDEMVKRGMHSPDRADALACTFFLRIARKDSPTHKYGSHRPKIAPGTNDYDPLSGWNGEH